MFIKLRLIWVYFLKAMQNNIKYSEHWWKTFSIQNLSN